MLGLFTVLSLLLAATAAPIAEPDVHIHDLIERQTAGCPRYTIINTRGTGEIQGESSGFRTMNSRIRSTKSGGSTYNTVYAAGFDQNSAAGTRDIVNKITTTLRSDAGHCFILEGYSQGAAATVAALPQLTGASFDAVKGVFLIGNPVHKSGLACNVDTNGGSTTANVNGISARLAAGIPSNWVSKSLDVCNFGDGVCDTTHGVGINAAHLAYPASSSTQSMGAEFVLAQLNGGSSGGSGGSGSGSGSGADACECRNPFFCPCRWKLSNAA